MGAEMGPECVQSDAKRQKITEPGDLEIHRKASNPCIPIPLKDELHNGSSDAVGAVDEAILNGEESVNSKFDSKFDYKQKYEEQKRICENLRTQLKAAQDCKKDNIPVSADTAFSEKTEPTINKDEGGSLDFASIVRRVVGHHVYCKRCYKSGPKCQCDVPLFSSSVCQECGGTDCYCNVGFEDEVHSAGTAEECVICERLEIDDQGLMGCCSGQSCSAKAHYTCTGFDSVHSQEGAHWRCSICIRNHVPLIESDTESGAEDCDEKTGTREEVRVFTKDEVEDEIRRALEAITPTIVTRAIQDMTTKYQDLAKQHEALQGKYHDMKCRYQEKLKK